MGIQEGDGTGVKYFKTRHINQGKDRDSKTVYGGMTRLAEIQKENVWNVTTTLVDMLHK